MESVDSPSLGLFNTPTAHSTHPRSATRQFALRSMHNFRQGNPALFVVFCACLIIFVRALFGVGYDEGSSAHADAASAKHPSLLARFRSEVHVDKQWDKLREGSADGSKSSHGLWAKISKEDDEHAATNSPAVPGAQALHWLRAMEDRALVGLGRRATHEASPEQDSAAQAPIVPPEHDISEDLDDHDGHDGDVEHTKGASAPAPPQQESLSTSPVESVQPRNEASASVEASDSPPVNSSPSPASIPPIRDSELEDEDDQPVYNKQGPK